MLNWQGSGGFSVDASVRIEAEDRAGIERLVRYCGSPAVRARTLARTRLDPSLASPESRLVYRFPKPDIHGRTELLLTPLELLDALATNASRRCPRSAPASASTPLPRCAGSQCHAQAPRRGIRSARARVRGASSRGRCRLTQPIPRARPCSGLAREGGTRAKRGSLGRAARSHLRRTAAALSRRAPREAWSAEMRILAFLTDPPVVSASSSTSTSPTNRRPSRPPAGHLRAISSPGSSIRHRPSTPPSPSPSPTSTSTSPCPTTSTSEAAPPWLPLSGRPGILLPAPSPPSAHLAGHYHTLRSRRSLAALSRPRRAPPPRLPCSASSPRAHPTSLPATKGPLNFLSLARHVARPPPWALSSDRRRER